MSSLSGAKPRVKIVSIVSNEAYFLPQWVYHHFYFGFNAIDLFINRNFDNSDKILRKLKREYPALNVYNWDCIDLLHPGTGIFSLLQPEAYTFAYMNSSDFDYILFIDVDEFYTPLNFRDTVQDCILRFGSPDAIMFIWMIPGMQPEYAMPIFSRRSIPLHAHHGGKTLVKTGLPVTRCDVHLPDVANVSMVTDGNGLKFEFLKPTSRLGWKERGTARENYFLLHDFNRSWVGHLAKLGVRNPKDLAAPFEYIMRLDGRLKDPASGNPEFHYVIENKIAKEYLRGFKNLVEKLNLQPELDEALLSLYYLALETIWLAEMYGKKSDLSLFISNFGNLGSIRDRLVSEISAMTGNSITPEDYLRVNWANPETGTPEQISANYQLAISMLPYMLDADRHPMFLKKYLSWLTGTGELQEAERVFINYRPPGCHPGFIA